MNRRVALSNDMAAEIAENTMVELEEFLHKEKVRLSGRSKSSLQDVIYWAIVAEAVEV
jgi:hypothetical protein